MPRPRTPHVSTWKSRRLSGDEENKAYTPESNVETMNANMTAIINLDKDDDKHETLKSAKVS